MKASALQEFLRSLGGSLVTVGVPPKSLDDLRSVAQALQPFADMDLEQLADFLKRAAEFRRTGAVPAANVPGLAEATKAARELAESVRALPAAEPTAAGEVEARILAERHALQTAVERVAGQFGVAVKFAENKKWLPELRARGAVARAAEGLRRLQSQITSHESYQSEPVSAAVGQLAAFDSKTLKAAAAQLGTTGSGSSRKFVESVLVKLTGIDNKPPKPAKKVKPPEPEASPEQVEAMVAALQAMVERAKDPDAVPDSEIDAILVRVGSEFSTDQQQAIAKRVTGKGGSSSKAAIQFLRDDLTAVRRALESQKV